MGNLCWQDLKELKNDNLLEVARRSASGTNPLASASAGCHTSFSPGALLQL